MPLLLIDAKNRGMGQQNQCALSYPAGFWLSKGQHSRVGSYITRHDRKNTTMYKYFPRGIIKTWRQTFVTCMFLDAVTSISWMCILLLINWYIVMGKCVCAALYSLMNKIRYIDRNIYTLRYRTGDQIATRTNNQVHESIMAWAKSIKIFCCCCCFLFFRLIFSNIYVFTCMVIQTEMLGYRLVVGFLI